MATPLENLIQTRYAQLPDRVRGHIDSLNMDNIIERGLRGTDAEVSDSSDLSNEVTLVLLGFESLADLAENIADNTDLSIAQAKIFVNNIRTDAFGPVEEELRTLWVEEEKKREEEEKLIREYEKAQEAPEETQKPATTTETTEAAPPANLPTETKQGEKKEDDGLSAVSGMLEKKMEGQSSSAYPQDPYREPINEGDKSL